MKKILLLALLLCLMAAGAEAGTVLGIERQGLYDGILAGKRVAVFTNQSGVDSRLNRSVDLLMEKYNVTEILVPEHGLFGAVEAGKEFGSHEYRGIPVYSLYGDTRRPTAEMLEKADIVCVDIQDVGIRHYTYFSSLAYIMEECAKAGRPVVVFDRPNPLGGAVQGPVLKPGQKSFIGLYEIPLRHGLTIGEFAMYINGTENMGCSLQVIPMKGWRRSMYWKDTGLPWVMSSPLIPTAQTAVMYGITGVSGDTNLSVGVGTAKPFFFAGAPFADAGAVKAALDSLNLEGVSFRAAAFTPRYGAYSGELVQGVEIYVSKPKKVNLPELDYLIMHTFMKLYPEQFAFPERGYGAEGCKTDIVLGETSIRDGEEPAAAFARWQQECRDFSVKAEPYLLYK